MRFRLWLEDDLEDRLSTMRGSSHPQQRTYGPDDAGEHPDRFLQGSSGYTFFYNPKDGRVHLGPIEGRHHAISKERTGGAYMLGNVTGRIRLPDGKDHLHYFKTDSPIITFWNNDEQLIKDALTAIRRDPQVAHIHNIEKAFVVVGGFYRGRINEFAPEADNQEIASIGGRPYRLRDLPATVHTLPPGEHRQAVINFICNSNSPILANYKHMCNNLATKSSNLQQKFYATQGD